MTTCRSIVLTGIFCVAMGGGEALPADVEPSMLPPESSLPSEKCLQRKIPIGLYGAANQLLEAAQYAQWVLEDIVCKYPGEEEAKKALNKLNNAISQAEGQ